MALDINQRINDHKDYFTTSSCAGRLILIEKDRVNSKYDTVFRFRTHDPRDIDRMHDLIFKETNEFSRFRFQNTLWILLEAPDFHVRCRTIDNALAMHKLALDAKLALSKYQSLEPSIVLEDRNLLISPDHLALVLKECKKLLTEDQNRLLAFYASVESLF